MRLYVLIVKPLSYVTGYHLQQKSFVWNLRWCSWICITMVLFLYWTVISAWQNFHAVFIVASECVCSLLFKLALQAPRQVKLLVLWRLPWGLATVALTLRSTMPTKQRSERHCRSVSRRVWSRERKFFSLPKYGNLTLLFPSYQHDSTKLHEPLHPSQHSLILYNLVPRPPSQTLSRSRGETRLFSTAAR